MLLALLFYASSFAFNFLAFSTDLDLVLLSDILAFFAAFNSSSLTLLSFYLSFLFALISLANASSFTFLSFSFIDLAFALIFSAAYYATALSTAAFIFCLSFFDIFLFFCGKSVLFIPSFVMK